ncbi:MAG: nucleotidyltransferase domain-containing protein [Candidatus Poribacteria bacterium]|nr:nucleotidyltransferase domain-containing protein [Candidatus Poribacteria bacterium]
MCVGETKDERQKVAEEGARMCVRVLKEQFGARDAFIFGSLRGDSPWNARSDVDIAVEGLPPGQYIEALTALYELLPPEIEIDLVPLEHAVPELVALARGEVRMPEVPIEALKMEVENELRNLERIVKATTTSFRRIRKPPNQQRILVFGKHIHDFYAGVERIFERIERRMELSIPIGSNWHTLLLQQMEHEVPEHRPAVIDHALALRLHRYLRFRHLFRHTYGYELVWDELRPLAEMLPELFAEFKTGVERFLKRSEEENKSRA